MKNRNFKTEMVIIMLLFVMVIIAGCDNDAINLDVPSLWAYIGAECDCPDWKNRNSNIEVLVTIGYHDYDWLPFVLSQDALLDTVDMNSTMCHVNEVTRKHRENSMEFHTTKNSMFFDEVGFCFDSNDYTITMSYFSSFNIVTFNTIDVFYEFKAVFANLTNSQVAQSASFIRLCNDPNKWNDWNDDGGNR